MHLRDVGTNLNDIYLTDSRKRASCLQRQASQEQLLSQIRYACQLVLWLSPMQRSAVISPGNSAKLLWGDWVEARTKDKPDFSMS